MKNINAEDEIIRQENMDLKAQLANVMLELRKKNQECKLNKAKMLQDSEMIDKLIQKVVEKDIICYQKHQNHLNLT